MNKTRDKVKVPYIGKELIDWLEEQYPEVLHDVGTPLESIHRYYGKRELVQRLRRLYHDADK